MTLAGKFFGIDVMDQDRSEQESIRNNRLYLKGNG